MTLMPSGPGDNMSASKFRPLRAFISYASEDMDCLTQLEKHLSPLKREGLLESWHDCMLMAGEERNTEIEKKLSEADIILILISADFIATDRCFEAELSSALVRKETNDAQVVAILARLIFLLQRLQIYIFYPQEHYQ